MLIEDPKRKIIIIDSVPPSGVYDSDYTGWIDTNTRTLKVRENGQWVEKIDFADPVVEGIDAIIKIANVTLHFESGVLVSYE